MADNSASKQKIAILGGGMASLTVAYELTSQPGWKDRYEITVYQQGFRLGGKGASGRNRDAHARIEEHGLHIWMGFYENAFRLMRDCYRELGRSSDMPLATWQDAFKPHDFIVLQEQVHGTWRSWPFQFPRNGAVPGDGGDLLMPLDYVRTMLLWMIDVLVASPIARRVEPYACKLRQILEGGANRAAELFQDSIDRDPIESTLDILLNLQQAAIDSIHSAESFLNAASHGDPFAFMDANLTSSEGHLALTRLLENLTGWLRQEFGERLSDDDDIRRLWILVDLCATNVRGIIREGLLSPPVDFTRIDDYDYKEWLRKHGASDVTVESAPVNAIYDLVFSRRHGIAAGTALSDTLRMLLTYKGAIFFKMQAGMGDCVFAPLYIVLKRRGVKFAFFHRVDALRVGSDSRSIVAIEMGRQVTLKQDEYLPLFDVKGLPCWPSAPLYEQIVEGEKLIEHRVDLEAFGTDWPDAEKIRLEAGKDFDWVVFGISLGAIKHLCKELLEVSSRLNESVDKLKAVGTQAFQIWLAPTLNQMGWKQSSPVLGTYEKPFDTWADMSHLLSCEQWPSPNAPGTIAYFCGELEDESGTAPGLSQHAMACTQAKANAVAWLKKAAGPLWPDATTKHNPDELNWYLLTDSADRNNEQRFDAQFWRGNVNPSDRYVLSVPGSTRYRLRAHESGFDNLVLTGDWILTGINGGCIEAAVMAGMQACRAISGYPKTIFGDNTHAPRTIPSPPEPPTVASHLPIYIDRGGELVLRQPFAQQGTHLFAFLLQANHEALMDLCDRFLNRPAKGACVYRPIAPMVALTFADIHAIRSLDSRDASKGWIPEKDVAFWVPVAAGSMHGQRFIPERLVWFIPYIFVDNPAAMATGREIFGFPKLLSTLTMPATETDVPNFAVDTVVLSRYGRDTKAEERRIMTVERTDGAAISPKSAIWQSVDGARAAMAQKIKDRLFGFANHAQPALPYLFDLFKVFSRGNVASIPLTSDKSLDETSLGLPSVRIVFLKQIRDATHPMRACYQAVIEAPATVTHFHGGGLLAGSYLLTIQDFDSLPITRDLGLAQGVISPMMSVWLDFDFNMAGGDIIWSAS